MENTEFSLGTLDEEGRVCSASGHRLEVIVTWVLAMLFFCVILSVIDLRPMHHDEANQAYSARRLLDFHGYFFRPEDHHGPTLYFLTLPVAWLCGVFRGASLSEGVVRLVPLLFSVGVLTVPLVMGRRLGRGSCVLSALSLCVSPCFCFYSNYFIQEMLLVFFVSCVLFSGWRWWESRERFWAIVFGVSGGLCVATKETWILCAASAGVAVLCLCVLHRRQAWPALRDLPWKEVGIAALCALAVDVVLFSSFFSNPEGILDFFRCWSHYFVRGTTSDTPFAAPFHQYLTWLFWFREEGTGPLWTEMVILVGFLLGVLSLFIPRLRPRGLRYEVLLFFVVYAVVLTVLYSMITYKTPWCSLGMLQGFALVSGMGYAGLVCSRRRLVCVASGLALLVGCWYMVGLCQRTMVRCCTDPRNPFAYAHTQRDYLRMVRRLKTFASKQGSFPTMLVCTNYVDAWPLPWYTLDEDGIVYLDFSAWEEDPKLDEKLVKELEKKPQFILANLNDETKFPHRDGYAWEQVTVRPNVQLSFGVRKDCVGDSIPAN